MDLTCLDDCVTEDRPLAYEPTTAGEYLDERLREIGFEKIRACGPKKNTDTSGNI